MRKNIKRLAVLLVVLLMSLLVSCSAAPAANTASPTVAHTVAPTVQITPTVTALPTQTEQPEQGGLLYEDVNISIEYLRCEDYSGFTTSDDGKTSPINYQSLVLQIDNKTDETLLIEFGFDDMNIYVDGSPIFGGENCRYINGSLPVQPGKSEQELDCCLNSLTPSSISGSVYIVGDKTIDEYTANFTPLNLD